MSSDPFNVCKFIAVIFLFVATIFSAACSFGAMTVALWGSAFAYGLCTIVSGSALRALIFLWFDVGGKETD